MGSNATPEPVQPDHVELDELDAAPADESSADYDTDETNGKGEQA